MSNVRISAGGTVHAFTNDMTACGKPIRFGGPFVRTVDEQVTCKTKACQNAAVCMAVGDGTSIRNSIRMFHAVNCACSSELPAVAGDVVDHEGRVWSVEDIGGTVHLVAWFGGRDHLSKPLTTAMSVQHVLSNCGTCGPRVSPGCGWCYPCDRQGARTGEQPVVKSLSEIVGTPLVFTIGSKRKNTSRNRRFRKGA